MQRVSQSQPPLTNQASEPITLCTPAAIHWKQDDGAVIPSPTNRSSIHQFPSEGAVTNQPVGGVL
ncbi:hypothetical protein N7527_011542 [Penicillium freii]|nr:hypothetical protein N7527_011542 [Penicillium freii]